ncbi:MAG: metallophosphoesterase family protein [Chloroflexi bacterium]|nr:metallophosphoesterase family protein [Chloroflexota bacterium]
MRTLLLSDIHANYPALKAVLADADGEFERAWVLGDTVGYGADPSDCIAAVRDLDALVISGNHELAAIGRISTADFNPVAREAIEWTANALDDDEREYLQSLPPKQVVDRFTLVHGSPRDPVWEYLGTGPAAVENLEHFQTQACAVGHSHVPFLVRVTADGVAGQVKHSPGQRISLGDDRLYLNPGSVGQPRDHDPRASYALIDIDAWDVEFRRVEYDLALAQARIREAGLPEFLAGRLSIGV